jgi:hypothetical protein
MTILNVLLWYEYCASSKKIDTMKKLFLIAIVSVAGFTSCKKCQTCTTTTTQDALLFPISTSTSEEYCGKEYDNAPAETSVTQEVGGISQSVTIECVDN